MCRTSVQLAKSFPMKMGVDLRNARGLAALMSAASSGNETMAFELVRGKADVNAVHQLPGEADRTAMDMAACAKRSDILDHLKRHGGYGLCEKKEKGDVSRWQGFGLVGALQPWPRSGGLPHCMHLAGFARVKKKSSCMHVV